MATNTNDAPGPTNPDTAPIDCPICLEPCVFPVELPCHHTFCYMCVKGTAVQATLQGQKPRCSMCRTEIPLHILSNPPLKDSSVLYKTVPSDVFKWYYECRSGGWWEFEERASKELEVAFDAKESICKLLLAGQMYEVDLVKMIQYRPTNPNAFRRIKRDLSSSTDTKGIAGIRIPNASSSSQSSSTAGNVRDDHGGTESLFQGDGGRTSSLASASALVPPSTIRAIASGTLGGHPDEDDDSLDLGIPLDDSDGEDEDSDYDEDEFSWSDYDEEEDGIQTPSAAANNPSGDPSNSRLTRSGIQVPPVPPTSSDNDGGTSAPSS